MSWFYVATFVIVPSQAVQVYGVAASTYFRRYGALGDSVGDIFKSLLTRPQLVWQIASETPRLRYVAGLLAIFGWLPLLGADVLLLSLPVLLANLLSAYPAQYYGEFHYSAPLLPYFAAAAAYGLGRLWRWLARRTNRSSASFQYMPAAGAGVMTAAALLQNSRNALRPLITAGLLVWMLAWAAAVYVDAGRGPLGGRFDNPAVTAHDRLLDRFVRQIPGDAAVTATASLHPHVSHRQFVYQFPLGLTAPQPAAWALIDVTSDTDMAPGDVKTQVDQMLAGGWGVVDGADGYLLLAKGAGARTIPPDFYSFVRQPAMNSTAAPGPLDLVGVSAEDWPRWRQTRLAADWRTGPGYDPTRDQPHIAVMTPDGAAVADLAAAPSPGLTWYPPSRWQPGDQLRLTTLPMALPRAVGLAAGADAAGLRAVLRRGQHDRLAELPGSTAAASDLAAALQPALLAPLRSAGGTFRLPDGKPLVVRTWLEDRRYTPGDAVDLWLQWTGKQWPENLAAFIHLRRAGVNVSQADGSPRFFLPQPADALPQHGYVNDWRQLPIPAQTDLTGEWTVVMGLYDRSTGQRSPLVDEQGKVVGDELSLGKIQLGPAPAPDQSCALLPDTCAAQPAGSP